MARLSVFAAAALALAVLPLGARAQAVPVTVAPRDGGFALVRAGKPYFIKGAGGDGSRKLLHDLGGNSLRTWGVEHMDDTLDAAQLHGLTVAAGIWLGHAEHGFKYSDPAQVGRQFATASDAIKRYRNHPALLLWALGNEMEGYGKGDDPAIWRAVNDLATECKKLDPNHPTMTVIAEIGGDRIASINRYCPAIDIIGINSYGGAASLPARYRAAGGVKPYIVTEFGPPGAWEIAKNSAGLIPELTSTEKAAKYAASYRGAIDGQPLCLGSYAFLWGNKPETTPTWFGLLLPDGSRLGATDLLAQLWGGSTPAHPCPEVRALSLSCGPVAAPGTPFHASSEVLHRAGQAVHIRWELRQDGADPPPGEVLAPTAGAGADGKLPLQPGDYRVYLFVHDDFGGAATGNVPVKVAPGAPTAR